MKFRTLIESSLVSLLAVASVSAQSTPAQKPVAKAGPVPRAADGHPDLSGIFTNATRTPFERPAVFEGRATISDEEARKWEARENERWEEGSKVDGGRPVSIEGGAYNVLFYDNGSELARIDGQKRTSMVVDPPDGHVPPIVPAARERLAQRRRADVAGDYKNLSADTRCLVGNTPSVPLVPALYNNNIEIVQSADSVLIEVEMVHDARIIHLNAKHQPPSVRQWFGDSVGHWEGDTLVVETTNFNGEERAGWLDVNGSPYTDALKMTERFRRPNFGTLEIDVTIDDPKAYTKPFTVRV
ncbi:MAG TPA: hypothetical protein VF146_01535, partial [Bryobacteraceae bacterium]